MNDELSWQEEVAVAIIFGVAVAFFVACVSTLVYGALVLLGIL